MKKMITLLLALVFTLALTACDELPAALTGKDREDDEMMEEITAPDADQDSGADSSDLELPNPDYYLGDTIQTLFFDYAVLDAMACNTYGDYTATVGNQLVVVSVHVQNTENYSMPMGQYDFQIQWGSGDEDFAFPLDQYGDDQLADDYEIPIGGSVEGKLVYEVPAGKKDFSVSFMEYYANESGDSEGEGDAYFTYFTAENTQAPA